MKIAKDGIRSIVRIGYDGKVHKTFRGTDKEDRFKNEIDVLKELEARGCDYVPRVLEYDEDTLTLVTTNCGHAVEQMSEERVKQIFADLESDFGVVHEDPFLRNITYDQHRGRFCVIDFELAKILGEPVTCDKVTTLSWAGLTKSGQRKEKNEDSYSVFSSEDGWAHEEDMCDSRSIETGNLIFAVSDGMGGHSGGHVASKLSVSQLHRYLPAMCDDDGSSASPLTLLENAIYSVHEHIMRVAEGNAEIHDMGATLVCALFFGGEMHFGHLGDSRLYRFRRGKLVQLTDDHTFVGRLFKQGKIDEKEARANPRRNILTQAIGARCDTITPQMGSCRVEKNDWYLICSDGLIDGLWDKHIEQEFLMAEVTHDSPEKVAEKLLNRAYENAGRDDTTLLVIKAEGSDAEK